MWYCAIGAKIYKAEGKWLPLTSFFDALLVPTMLGEP